MPKAKLEHRIPNESNEPDDPVFPGSMDRKKPQVEGE